MNFVDELAAAFPAANPLPPLLQQTLEMLEAHGCVRTLGNGERYMTAHPEPENSDRCTTAFYLPTPEDTASWTATEDEQVNNRLVIFLRTGGDGSWAGLWVDDDGQQRLVHLGSGSGSVMLCVLTHTTEDLLRLLAIGYDELCWPDQFSLSPDEVRDELCEDGDDRYPPAPLLLRRYVEHTLGLSVPARASAIVTQTVSMDDAESDDPFWNWLKQVRGE